GVHACARDRLGVRASRLAPRATRAPRLGIGGCRRRPRGRQLPSALLLAAGRTAGAACLGGPAPFWPPGARAFGGGGGGGCACSRSALAAFRRCAGELALAR